jgi:hypothetical protein
MAEELGARRSRVDARRVSTSAVVDSKALGHSTRSEGEAVMSYLRGAVLASLVVVLAGCATALPAARDLQPQDVHRLAGSWTWTAWSSTPAHLGAGPIKVKVADGRLQFEAKDAVGTLVFYEDANRRVLRGEGRGRTGGGPFVVELTQRGPVSPATAAFDTSGQVVFALIVVQ